VGEDGSQAAEGEVCVGGVAVARGYLGRAALTAERFVPDPFAGRPGARMYRTGDRARWREVREGEGTAVRECESARVRKWNGEPDASSRAESALALSDSRTFVLEFLGRLDDQVKVGGYRVEPAEVEAVLAEHPQVAQAAVAARRGDDGAARLHGWAVVRPGVSTDAAALRTWLRGRLPAYMVPSTLTLLPALPLNANGKVDRRALPTPALESPESDVSPSSESPDDAHGDTARALAAIWREVLGAPAGPDDDFFEAGGHSLLAMLVLSRVRRRWGVDLPVRALFEARTPAALAARIHAAAAESIPQPPLAPARRGGALPLSFGQQGLWLLHQMEPGISSYNIPLRTRLTGALDAGALRRALAEIVRRHEALRTVFRAQGTGDGGQPTGAPVQVILPAPGDFDLPLTDLAAWGREEAEDEAGRIARAEAAAPFDLSADAMLRGRLVRVGEDEHLLLLTVHHIAADGWSLGILFRELAALYEAFAGGRPSPLAELPLQYADFAAWQRAWLDGDALDAQLAWWRDRLAGAPGVLELPTDFPRPAVPARHGAVARFRVPRELAARLREAARRHDATLFMVLLAGFDLLLHRLGGGDDVVVGSPVAGRTRPETEGLIGFFINTVALRTSLGGDPAVGELIRRVREATLEAYARQELPFERLVEALHPERARGQNPVFQASFAMGNVEMDPVALAGVRARAEDTDNGAAKFDLFLEMREEADGGIRGDLEYAAELWEPASAARMTALYLRLLGALAGDAERPLFDAVALADAADARAEEARWNRTARGYPRDSTIHAQFAAAARARPGAVALAWDGGEMTYGELDARSSRLANHLVRRGVRPDEPVAVLLRRSPEMVVAFLAILKAGGAYVPLNPQYPAGRTALMLADSGARLLITDTGRGTGDGGRETGGWTADEPGTVLLDGDAAAIGGEPTDAPRVEVSARNAAYVIYTSGSTGTPKGVVVPHRAVLRLVMGADYARLGPGETWLQMVPASFDVSTLEIWGPLLNGARIALYPPETPEPARLGAFIRRHGVTSAWLTSAVFHQVVDHDVGALAGLRQVLSGGDVVSAAHARRVLDACPGVRLVNGYGPTENTTFSTCRTVTRDDAARVSIPIGTPIANSTAYVLDARMRPVPATVPGELYVGGDGVARGYLNAPALTAERFVPDPFAADGSRLYRTGDRARRRDDGTLEFMGRIDQQVKIRGHRTEPGEVEAVLGRHRAVASAVVTVRDDGAGGRRLVAYVVPAPGARKDELPGALRAYARGVLPEHMVPSAVVVMEALPVTPNGKVDRRALPAPPPPRAGAAAAPPRTETERRLAVMWAGLLGRERVGIHESFFEMGGHSLLAVQMAARVREDFGVEISVPQVLDEDSVARLAALVDAGVAAMTAELEAELEMLSDDEVRALLASEALDGTAAGGGQA
ncbi:MAG TPA: amino acid adenylation domain-containing protein, partial [Longimicrobium sp.]|nr:amino acid adenylation domain-containing protein [Longimicrobium sp.]